MQFYDEGRKERDFESGIGAALEAILASPQFLFRVEAAPPRAQAPGSATALRDLDLASRLSFFLWGTAPDAELMQVAAQGRLTRAGRAREAGAAACSRTRAPKRCRRASRRSGCGCRTSRRSCPTRCSIPYFDHTLGRRAGARDRAVLRQPRARGSQRARSADRRLHLRERAARASTTASPNVTGTDVPARRRAGVRGAASSATAAC